MAVATPIGVDIRTLAEILPRIEVAVLGAIDADQAPQTLEGDADGDA